MTGRYLRGATFALAWTAAAIVTAEVVSRQLTRSRMFAWLPDDPGWLAVWPVAALGVLLLARGLSSRASPPGRPGAMTAAVFAMLFSAGLAVQLELGARLQSDGFYYFAYLRSLAFDRDVNFLNDYRLIGLGDKRYLFEPTRTGHAHSAWTIGPAIVWAPFFGGGHLAATRLRANGADVAVNGTSYPYRQAICIAGLAYALLGLWFVIRATRELFTASTAAIAAALTVGGSFMLWYSLAEPTMTHAPTMAGVAGFTWYWLRTRGDRPLVHWIGLGAVAGFITLIRWQSALFALLPACEALVAIARASRWGQTRGSDPGVRPRGLTPTIAGGLAFTAAATVAFIPQMLAWKAIYGSYLAVSPLGPEIRWWDPHLVDILFSSRNGLFALSPILYVGAIGLIPFAWRRPDVGVPALVALAAMIYFNGSIQDWWGSAGYGGRRFDGVIVILAIGMAAAFDRLRELVARRPRLIAALVLAAGVIWNMTLMGAARDGDVRPGEALSFREAGAAQTRLLHSWIGHPFSYPVNLWFAARNDVSPAAYDLLAALAFLGDPLRPYGRVDLGTADDPFVLDGWSAVAREGDISFRSISQPAGVIVPLNYAEDLDLQLRLRGRDSAATPAQPIAVAVEIDGKRVGVATAIAEWQTAVIATPKSAWRRGVNRVRLSPDAGPPVAGSTGRVVDVDYVRVQVRAAGSSR